MNQNQPSLKGNIKEWLTKIEILVKTSNKMESIHFIQSNQSAGALVRRTNLRSVNEMGSLELSPNQSDMERLELVPCPNKFKIKEMILIN